MRPTFPPPPHVSPTSGGFLAFPNTLSHSGMRHRDIERVSMVPPPQPSPYHKNVDGASGQGSRSSLPPQTHHTTASSSYHFPSRPLRVLGAPFDHNADVYSDSARTSVSPGHGHRRDTQPFPPSFHAPLRTAVARSYRHDRAVSERRHAASGARDVVDRMVAERLYEKDVIDSDGPVKRSRSLLSRLIGCDDVTAITKVILSSPSQGLKLRNICKELESKYAGLRGRSDWHVRVRYLLCQKNRFVRDDDEDEYEDDDGDGDGEKMGGTWRVDLSLQGNRLRQGVTKSPVVQTKSAATAKSSKTFGKTKSARKRSSTIESDVKRRKALQAKKQERKSPAVPRTSPARPNRWYLDPLAKDNPRVRLPPVSTLLELHPL